MADLRAIVGSKVRQLRESHKLSQRELAAAAGTSFVTISSIENADTATNLDLLERIAKQLGVHPWELLGGPAQAIQRPVRQKDVHDPLAARVERLSTAGLTDQQRRGLEAMLQMLEDELGIGDKARQT